LTELPILTFSKAGNKGMVRKYRPHYRGVIIRDCLLKACHSLIS